MGDLYGDIYREQLKQGNMGGIKGKDYDDNKPKKIDMTEYDVYIENGIVLEATDSNGLSDPYVKISVIKQNGKTSQVFRSKVCKKTLEPNWSEEGKMHIDEDVKQLKIELFDQDLIGRNDLIGSNIVDLTGKGGRQKHDIEMWSYKDGERDDIKGSVKFSFEQVYGSLVGTGKFGAF